jgi:hypothetical protein
MYDTPLAIARHQPELGTPATLATSKAMSLKFDHGLFIFGIDRRFVIQGKAHGHKSSDRGYPLGAKV